MANEYKLSYTASEINEKLGKIGNMSWNDLTDKPFGEGGCDTIEFKPMSEVEIEALVASGKLVAGMLLKISNTPITMNDLVGGYTFTIGEQTTEVTSEMLGEALEQIAPGVLGITIVISVEPSAVGVDLDGLVFSEPGVYLIAEVLSLGCSITIPGYTGFGDAKPIDPKYLPKMVVEFFTEDGQNFTVNKTYAEIAAAYKAGYEISGLAQTMYPLSLSQVPSAISSSFEFIGMIPTLQSRNIQAMVITVKDDDSLEYEVATIAVSV